MNVVLLGPPGSGKGTQAHKLASQFGMSHISTGDVFREAIHAKSELGQEIQLFVCVVNKRSAEIQKLAILFLKMFFHFCKIFSNFSSF